MILCDLGLLLCTIICLFSLWSHTFVPFNWTFSLQLPRFPVRDRNVLESPFLHLNLFLGRQRYNSAIIFGAGHSESECDLLMNYFWFCNVEEDDRRNNFMSSSLFLRNHHHGQGLNFLIHHSSRWFNPGSRKIISKYLWSPGVQREKWQSGLLLKGI